MSALILPRRFIQQPQWPAEIDWGNPLTRGVVVAVAGNERLNNAGQRFPTITGSVARLGSPHGAAHSFSAGAYFDYGHTAATEITGPITIFGLLRPVSGATQARIISKATVDQTDNPYRLSFESSTNGLYWLRSATAGVYGAWHPNAAAVTAGVMGMFAVVSPGSTIETTPRFYTGLSGSDLGATRLFSSHTGSVTSSGAPLRIGNWNTGSQVDIALLLVFGRAISGDEYAALATNPWQIFKPRRQVLYFGGSGSTNTDSAAAAGSITLAGSAAAGLRALASAAGAGSYTLTGSASAAVRALLSAASAGQIILTGSAAAGVYTPVGAYNSAASAGAITITGSAATGTRALQSAAAAGSYDILGSAASAIQAIPSAADAGEITLTGSAALALWHRLSAAEAGSYVITGSAASGTSSAALTDSQKIDLILDILNNNVLPRLANLDAAVSDVPADVLAAAQAAPIHADLRKVRGQVVTGAGTEADPWGP